MFMTSLSTLKRIKYSASGTMLPITNAVKDQTDHPGALINFLIRKKLQ